VVEQAEQVKQISRAAREAKAATFGAFRKISCIKKKVDWQQPESIFSHSEDYYPPSFSK